MKESYIFLAPGFEEIEAITPIDVLRRAGMPVKIVSVTDSMIVTGAHGVGIKAEMLYDDAAIGRAEWLILPGGLPGADNLHEHMPLLGLLQRQKESSGNIAAICAAPAVVLGAENMLEGYKATCYPGFEDKLIGAEYLDEKVVVDRNIITGNGPSSALLWSLAIVAKTLGEEKSREVATGMLLYHDNGDRVTNLFG